MISFAGLLAQFLDLKKSCRARSCGEEYYINSEGNTCYECEIECCSGPCGSVFNEFVLGFLRELLIIHQLFATSLGLPMHGRSWEFKNGWDGIDTVLMVANILTDLVYAKGQYVSQLFRAMRKLTRDMMKHLVARWPVEDVVANVCAPQLLCYWFTAFYYL